MALINKPKPQAQAQQSELKPFRAYPCEASCKSKANVFFFFFFVRIKCLIISL